jgi:hypothetical protein
MLMDSSSKLDIYARVDTSIFFYSKGETLDENDYEQIIDIYIDILERRWYDVRD